MNHQSLIIYREQEKELVRREFESLGIDEVIPGVVTISSAGYPPESIFARQMLSEAIPYLDLSIKALGQEVIALIADRLRAEVPWRFHVFDMGTIETGKCFQRTRLVREAISEWLRKKNRSLKKFLVENDAPVSKSERLVQVFVPDKERAWVSISDLQPEKFWPVPFSGGCIVIPDRRDLPSRAFKKLLEAEILLGQKITKNEIVYDLGASPGGWTAIAAERGAKVFAVDRSPLEDNLMRNRAVTFIKGDAFKVFPERAADWMLSDVAAFPEKTLEMVQSWIERKACKKMCVTFKFTGVPQEKLLREAQATVRKHFKIAFLRRLSNNKNEITLAGCL